MTVQDAQSNTRLDDETLRELGLTEQPFEENKKRQPVADATALKTRAALEQHVRFGDPLHLLTGEQGSGKTVLLQQLLKHCKSSIKPFVVKGSDEFQANAFLYAVLNDLNQEEHTAESVEELIEALDPIFEQITADQLSAVLIVDDAHLAPIEEIAILVDSLQRFDGDNGKTARLLLTGEPALAQSIARYEQQFEGLNLQYSTTEMQPFDETRTREYLSTRLHQAGFADAFPFTDKAIAKIQQDSDGLPGRINHSASGYLNGVYRNAGKGNTKAGRLSAVEWPVLAIGAAALGAIGIGLSMFFGNKPETDVIPVAASDTTTQIEQPVVAPTSVPDSTTSLSTNISPQDPLINVQDPLVNAQDTLVNGTEPSFQSNINNNSNSLSDTAGNAPVESVVADESTGMSNRLVLPEANTPEMQAALPDSEAPTFSADPLSNGSTDLRNDSGAVDFNAPGAAGGQLTALDKSVGNNPTRSLDPLTDSSLRDNAANNTAFDQGIAAISSTGNEISAGLLDGDTDAAAPAPEAPLTGSSSDTAPAADPIASTLAIENERWVLFQAPQKFTVQLATSRERSYIIDLAQTMEIQDPVAIYPFLTTNSNNPVFGLLSGLYDTRAEAIAAVEGMSDSSKKFGVWIRPVSDLQDDIKRQK